MKRIALLSLGVLLLATACNNPSTNGKPENAQSEPQPATVTEIVPVRAMDYYLWNDEKPAIKGEIKDGSVWLTFDKEQIMPVTVVDEDVYRLPDWPVEVEGLLAEPQSIMISDIGQDFNPILCVLLPEGKVQVLNLWNSVETGDLTANQIPMEGMIGFEAGPGGEYETEDGEIGFDYVTIYAFDAQGVKEEIPMYLLDHNLEYSEKYDELVFRLYLTEDWKMSYVVENLVDNKMEEERGRFWEIESDWDNMVFRYGYELNEAFVYSMDGVKGNEENCKGVFEVRKNDGEWEATYVTPIEGIDFCQKGMNNPVRFEQGSAYGG
jgi:hypothetical protein